MPSAGGTLTEPRVLEDDLLAVDPLGNEPPLIAVEAKGDTETGRVDVEHGVVQAHDRLAAENVAVDRGGELLT